MRKAKRALAIPHSDKKKCLKTASKSICPLLVNFFARFFTAQGNNQ